MARVFVSVGSNIDRSKNIRQCIDSLRELYGELILSTTWENSAIGFDGDPFYNLVVGFDTRDSPEQVAHAFREIEMRQGRERSSERFSSRTLDIDLLLYDQLIRNSGGLQIPRDEIARYAFVLKPLAEVYPDGIHPELGKTYKKMWQSLETGEEKMTLVEEFPARY